jgi:hypothetical protein
MTRRFALSVALTLAAFPRLAAQSISVGPNVQVSTERPAIVHDEVTIAAHPGNPNHLIACALVMPLGKEKMYDIAYSSLDGGKTWSVAVDLDGRFSADVDCRFGPDGSAYFTANVFGKGLNPPPDAWVYRSPDGGRTWLPPSIAREVNDRQFLSIDHSDGPNRGRVYLSYRKNFYGLDADPFERPNSSGIGVQVSTDAGKTWNLTAIRPAMPGLDKVHGYPTYSTVLSDGTLVIPVMEWQIPDAIGGIRKGAIKVLRSTDGGQTLLKSVTATEVRSEMVPHVSAFLPFVAADPGSAAFKDRIYIAWADVRSGRWEIWFTYSADKGLTWARPRIVSDDVARADTPGPDDFNATLAVNKDGVVAVAWYDRRDNPDNIGWFVRLTASLDGGDTWLPSVRVSEAPNVFQGKERLPLDDDVRFDALGTEPANILIHLQSRTLYAGHTAGMTASADGSFYPLWVDNRTGIPQAWTARVTVPGIAAVHGGGGLADFRDVSGRIAVEVLNAEHDASAGTITATVRLRNRSQETIRGPFRLRALSLKSDIGDVTATNADNDIAGPGAVWDLSNAVRDGRLEPDQASTEKTLVFRVKQTRPFKQGKQVQLTLVNADVRVLALPQK